MIYCYRLCKRVFLCLHYRSDKQLLILTDKGLCLYNSSSLFLLWLPLGSSWALFAYYVPGGGGVGARVSEGRYNFLRGLILRNQF